MKSGLNIQNWLWKVFRKKKYKEGKIKAEGRLRGAPSRLIHRESERPVVLGSVRPVGRSGSCLRKVRGGGGDSARAQAGTSPSPQSYLPLLPAPGARRRLVPRSLRSDPVAKAPEGRCGRAATRLGPASGAPTTPRGAMGRSKRPLPPSARDRAPRARVVPGRVGRARRGPAAPTGPAAAPWGGSGCSVQRGGEEGAGPEAPGRINDARDRDRPRVSLPCGALWAGRRVPAFPKAGWPSGSPTPRRGLPPPPASEGAEPVTSPLWA